MYERQKRNTDYKTKRKKSSIHTMTSADHEYLDYDNDLYNKVHELKEKYKNDPLKAKINEIIRRETRPFSNAF